MAETKGAATMRLDRFLWFARIVKKREWAQSMAAAGHLRIDGRAVGKPAALIRPGQVLTFATGGRVRAIRIAALPARRGPPEEARLCYEDLLPPAACENVSRQAAHD